MSENEKRKLDLIFPKTEGFEPGDVFILIAQMKDNEKWASLFQYIFKDALEIEDLVDDIFKYAIDTFKEEVLKNKGGK